MYSSWSHKVARKVEGETDFYYLPLQASFHTNHALTFPFLQIILNPYFSFLTPMKIVVEGKAKHIPLTSIPIPSTVL